MRVLLLTRGYTTYISQLVNQISKRYTDVDFSIFTSESASKSFREDIKKNIAFYTFPDIDSSLTVHGISEVRKAAKGLPEFDIIHSIWFETIWGCAADIFEKKALHIFGSVGGSDVYRKRARLDGVYSFLQKRFVKCCDYFSAETTDSSRKFYEKFGTEFSKKPIDIIRYGVDIIDYFEEVDRIPVDERLNYFGIPSGGIRVAMAYHSRKEHQHLKMIQAINEMPEVLRKKLVLIFPMSGGLGNQSSEDYLAEVERCLKESGLKYVILDRWLNTKEMAMYISVSDIMLHFQTTDQLSSTMVAHMYHGNIVLAGSWLPYQDLRDAGVFFESCDDFEVLTEKLTQTVSYIEDYKEMAKANTEVVKGLSTWDVSAKAWHRAYENMMSGKVNGDA